MSKTQPSGLRTREFPSLPEEAKTPRGIVFHPREDVWSFRDALYDVYLNFRKIRPYTTLIDNLKYVICWYMENGSAKTAEANYYRAKSFFEYTFPNKLDVVQEISVEDILNYRSSYGVENPRAFSSFLSLLKKWNALGVPGVSEDACSLIRKIKVKSHPEGESVSTMDPYKGPFTDIEFDAIQSKLNFAYEDGQIDLEGYVLALLNKSLGQRPIQYAALKVCDFSSPLSGDGEGAYSLKVPRAKQQGRLIRDDFKERLLTSSLGKLVALHCEEVERKFTGILEDPKQAPMFPAKKSKQNEPPGFEYHLTAAQVNECLAEVINSLEVVSERTGELLNITTYRFRRTVGTRAAVEGHGELVIAELLDHSDTQCVGIYVKAVPKIVERIDRAMALHLAPLAQAFEGVIISNETEAICSDDAVPGRICDPRFDPTMKPMGSCGKHGFCESIAPIACYTCRSFQPWLDGPHEAVLEYLIDERERQLDANDSRIASINDRTILAVAEVVRRCSEMKISKSLSNG